MQIILDTEKLSKEANKLMRSLEDPQLFIVELIEKQAEEIQSGDQIQSIVEILRRLEMKVDNLEGSTFRRSNTIGQMKERNSTDSIMQDDSQAASNNQNDAEHKKAAEELAKALDFFG